MATNATRNPKVISHESANRNATMMVGFRSVWGMGRSGLLGFVEPALPMSASSVPRPAGACVARFRSLNVRTRRVMVKMKVTPQLAGVR